MAKDPPMAREVEELKASDLDALEKIAKAATRRLAAGKWKRDGYGSMIWAPSLKGGDTRIADIRGWGYLTGGGHGALGLSQEDGIAAQNAWGDHIATFDPPTILALIALARRSLPSPEAGGDETALAMLASAPQPGELKCPISGEPRCCAPGDCWKHTREMCS